MTLKSDRLAAIFFGASIFTLPWCGVGTLTLLSGKDWGFGLQPSWLFLLLGLLVSTARMGSDGQVLAQIWRPANLSVQRRQFFRWALPAILVVLLASGLGLVLAPSVEGKAVAGSRYLKQIVQLLGMLAFVLWSAFWIRGQQRWHLVLRCLLAGVAFQVLYGLLQGASFYLDSSWFETLDRIFTSNPAILAGSEQLYLDNQMQDVPRLRGTMCEPLYLGNFLLLVIPWILCGPLRRPLRWTLLAGVLLLLVLTWSRGAWLSALGMLLLAGTLQMARNMKGHSQGESPTQDGAGHFRSRGLWVGLGLAGAVLVLVAIWKAPSTLLVDRLMQSFSTQDWSNLTRFYSMQAAWRAFLLSPVVGVGWGQFAFHFPVLVDPMGLQSQFTWPVVNNFPLMVLCETGLLGLGLFLALTITLWRSSLKSFFQHEGPGSSRVLAGLMGVFGVWLQLLTFSQYNLPHIWLAVGLLVAALLDDQEDPASTEVIS